MDQRIDNDSQPRFASENGQMGSPHLRSEGPQRRRMFSPAEKLAPLVAYEQAC